MKQRHRVRAMDDLLGSIESSDVDAREYALFQLASIFQRSNDAPPDHAISLELPRHLRSLRLSADDQTRIVKRLSQRISAEPDQAASLLWALGYAMPEILWRALPEVIAFQGMEFSDEAAYQACVALNRCLSEMPIKRPAHEAAIGPALDRWRDSRGRRLSSAAGKLIATLSQISDAWSERLPCAIMKAARE